ncbi:MAG: type II toxin-antitoxin system PemK/MazF family toxin [Thermoleophilia bacterium]|nr:type II toxin-antitoxin system PemK/MazF family toxin [Thermoleophilia bacterium]
MVIDAISCLRAEQVRALMQERRARIYIVDFDHAMGSEQGKKGPALVIQNNLGNQSSSITIVIAISSRVPFKRYPMHVPLPPGVLSRPGIITCEQIRTVSLERVEPAVLAELSREVTAQVEEALSHSLGISEETAGL